MDETKLKEYKELQDQVATINRKLASLRARKEVAEQQLRDSLMTLGVTDMPSFKKRMVDIEQQFNLEVEAAKKYILEMVEKLTALEK